MGKVKVGAEVIVLLACFVATALMDGWAAMIGSVVGFGLLILLARREQRRVRALPRSEGESEDLPQEQL